MILNDLQRGSAGVACIGTQILAASHGRIGALDHDGIEHGFQLRNIMPFGPCHDEPRGLWLTTTPPPVFRVWLY